MLHPPNEVVSSFHFPNFLQQPVPGRALPPSQPYMGTAITSRGRIGTGIRLAYHIRHGLVEGRFFNSDGHVELRFVSGEIYSCSSLTWLEFQLMANTQHPTRVALSLKIGAFDDKRPMTRIRHFSGPGEFKFLVPGY